MSEVVGSLDADGIMVRVAATLGESHARRGFEPYLRRWNTPARTRAYFDAYRKAKTADRTRT